MEIPKEYLIDFDNLKVGDTVWLHGQIEGIILTIDNMSTYPITLKVHDKHNTCYTKEGKYQFTDNHISLFAKPFDFKEQERVILVRTLSICSWEKRVLLQIKNDKAICWFDAETLEQAKNITKTAIWDEWKEIDEEEIHLTLQEISDGKGVGVPAHLLRIKQ